MAQRPEQVVPVKPYPDPGVIDCLGKLAGNGMGIVYACEDCPRTLALDLDKAIRLWGRNQVHINWRPPIKCAECGSKNVSGRVQAKVPGR